MRNIYYICFLFSLIIFISSCKKNEPAALSDTDRITSARQYFEKDIQRFQTDGSASSGSRLKRQSIFKNALWNEAYVKDISLGKAVVVPLHYDKTIYTRRGEAQSSLSLDNLSYLMIYEGKDHKMRTEVVTWIPDNDFWDKKNKKKLAFKGVILIDDWQGKFIKGYKYLGNGEVKNVSADTYTGTDVHTSMLQCVLVTWYSCSSSDGGNVWYCSTLYSETICEDDGSGSGGGGGGGDPGDYPPPGYDPCGPPMTGSVHVSTLPCSPAGGGSEYDLKYDSLKKDYPCAVKLIIKKLETIAQYQNLISPFNTVNRPNIIWNHSVQDYGNNNIYSLGNTESDPSGLGLSSTIKFNNSALNNSSLLLLAATAIHETSHAYSNYAIKINGYNAQYLEDYGWVESMFTFHLLDSLHNANPNYIDHFSFIANSFDSMVQTLSAWDNNQHSTDEYRMAMMFGLNNPGSNATSSQVNLLNNLYSQLMNRYNLSASEMNSFYNTNLHATTDKRLPTNCP
ncbi:hypothetical protein GS399_03110 [Pedobacter sp. HMF7647]|uniref:Uncharacterized protein n=1 Tax=Hufsiella arboris TaxID=2695275 RepID=A0A7K1Y5U2_9SPHI|nr:hypothetical protein [Hufsiella arboris]MXV49947.1 hypothetical protein [Hufsiella arboris]